LFAPRTREYGANAATALPARVLLSNLRRVIGSMIVLSISAIGQSVVSTNYNAVRYQIPSMKAILLLALKAPCNKCAGSGIIQWMNWA
jgi:hypothetical protein